MESKWPISGQMHEISDEITKKDEITEKRTKLPKKGRNYRKKNVIMEKGT